MKNELCFEFFKGLYYPAETLC